MQNLLASKSLIEQSKNLPTTFERHSSLNFLTPSQTFRHLELDSPLHQASTTSNSKLKLFSPNLIQEEKPLLLSKIIPFFLPQTSSMEISNVLDSTANQHLPPFETPLPSERVAISSLPQYTLSNNQTRITLRNTGETGNLQP